MGRLSGRGSVGPVIALAMVLAVAFPAGLMTTASAGPDATFTVTGDIDGCAKGEDTAELVAKTAGPIATVGDNAYPEATTEALKRCYEPSWGRFKDRTRPVPGNHDYEASKATPYFEYFGAAAGEPGRGWYSYDVGAWHVVALNSNCDAVDCGQESTWLETDLRAHPSACIAAYWHHPRFSSGTSGGDEAVGAFWKVLYNHGASVVFNGHDHDYERFASQDPSGHRDPARGIREFVVGTGGASIGSFGGAAPNSEVRNNRSYGVLALTLRPGGYDWRFVSAAGDSFTDSGSDTCRGTAPAPAVAPSTAPSEPPPTAAPDPEPATPEEPAPSDSPATPPGPQEGSSKPRPTAPAPSDPSSGRRRPKGVLGPTLSPAPGNGSAAGSSGNAVRPPAPTTTVPATPFEGDLAAPADPPAAVPVDAPTGRRSSPLGILPGSPGSPGGSDLTGPPADSASLALALSGLTHPAPLQRPDRRGVAFMAIALLVADAALITALRRRAVGLPVP